MTSKTENKDSQPGIGILLLGWGIIGVAMFFALFPLLDLVRSSHKPEDNLAFGAAAVLLMVGVGLVRRSFYAWIASAILFCLAALANLWLWAREGSDLAIVLSIISLWILLVLAKCKHQTVKNDRD